MIALSLTLTDPIFWVTAALAAILLNAIAQPLLWRALSAALNLGFLAVLLGPRVVWVVLALALLLLALRALSSPRSRTPVLLLAAAALMALFLLNKLPLPYFQLRLEPLKSVLSLIGFSYIALRLVELFRAVAERRHPAPDFLSLVNYLLPFHMLAAGPIQAYDDFAARPPLPPPLSVLDALRALERVAFGLFKKYVLATLIAETFLTDFAVLSAYTLVEVQFFFLWLYLDFSAYSDIAVGLGRLMGIPTPENFNRPYLARNMIDFWERWHISLSLFLRRNIYIPVFASLTRRSPDSDPLALSAVAFISAFLLCGLWHDLSLNFFLWGAVHALGLVVASVYHHELRKRLDARQWKAYRAHPLIRAAAMVLTYEFVAFSMLVIFFPR